MKNLSFPIVAALMGVTGCMVASDPQISCWPVEFVPTTAAALPASPDLESVRISQVMVRAPYNSKSMVVLRQDGTVAFDAYNEYAALPTALLKGIAEDAFRATGRFRQVVGSVSSLKADLSAEIAIVRMALDCRTAARREATVALEVRLLRKGEPVARLTGDAKCDAADGAYGAAFSRAMTVALEQALGKLGR